MPSFPITTVAFVSIALLGACQTPSPPFTPAPPSPEGATIYQSHCALCHGADGVMVAGVTNPVSIGSQAFLTTVDDAFLRQTIANGRPGDNGRLAPGTRMPAFGDASSPVLSPQQIDDVVRHLRSWQLEPSVPIPEFDAAGGDAERGADLYASLCATCHGPDGWGDKAPRLAGSTLQESASDAWIRHVVLSGRGTTMPAFRLDDRELADLIAHVRGLDHWPPR